eukprot:SAG31_NODE_1554_length_7897_cov_13.662221_7_plen_158_part_00
MHLKHRFYAYDYSFAFVWPDANRLSGTIPTFLGNLTALTNLELKGEHAKSVPRSDTPSIEHEVSISAWLDNTKLSGTIAETIGHLTALTWLDFGEYAKWGPVELNGHPCVYAAQCDIIFTDQTSLSGTISDSLGHLTALSFLALREYATSPLADRCV